MAHDPPADDGAAAREPRMPRCQRRRDPNDPDDRSSQMLLVLADCHNRDRNAGARPAAASRTSVAQEHGASMNIK